MTKPLVIEAPNQIPESHISDLKYSAGGNIKIFLAGGITGCEDWQSKAIEMLDGIDRAIIFNPRRKEFNVNDPSVAKEQIEWEHQKMLEANIVLFWFSPETLNPITLFELGVAIERFFIDKRI